MNAAVVRELFDYNAWADKRIFEAIAALPTEQYQRDLKTSFGSIHGTIAHIVGAERVWLFRWKQKPASLMGAADFASLADVRKMWDEVEAERTAFLGGLTDAMLESKIVIKPTGGGEYVHSLRQTMLHTVDHSSYHRGQIVTLLRQLGVKPPSVGLIGYYRQLTPKS